MLPLPSGSFADDTARDEDFDANDDDGGGNLEEDEGGNAEEDEGGNAEEDEGGSSEGSDDWNPAKECLSKWPCVLTRTLRLALRIQLKWQGAGSWSDMSYGGLVGMSQ